ncbi:hypothetical protein GXM_06296 [Nostoc sphaeroides CCNUC1]|uniref:Uncharacterized protein n=1 Tax=Nostoc sphaeroides CCNUC1 TaxID=2653204 RepID=A0A5P8W891_9NOSO|nr:hypothetical protein GXM_06296 [Nostoc sphaeroides CCNUC1]
MRFSAKPQLQTSDDYLRRLTYTKTNDRTVAAGGSFSEEVSAKRIWGGGFPQSKFYTAFIDCRRCE